MYGVAQCAATGEATRAKGERELLELPSLSQKLVRVHYYLLAFLDCILRKKVQEKSITKQQIDDLELKCSNFTIQHNCLEQIRGDDEKLKSGFMID